VRLVPCHHGVSADSDRWQRFKPRSGEVVIITPSKPGTTSTQVVGMLLHDASDLGVPIAHLSPWLDRSSAPTTR